MARLVALLGVGGVCWYGYALLGQTADVEKICARFPDEPGAETVIFCAGLTLCDVSCRIEYRSGKITRSELSHR